MVWSLLPQVLLVFLLRVVIGSVILILNFSKKFTRLSSQFQIHVFRLLQVWCHIIGLQFLSITTNNNNNVDHNPVLLRRVLWWRLSFPSLINDPTQRPLIACDQCRVLSNKAIRLELQCRVSHLYHGFPPCIEGSLICMDDFMELTSHIYLVVVCLIYELGTYNCKDKCIDSI